MSGPVDDVSDSLVDKVLTEQLGSDHGRWGGGPTLYSAPRSCVTQGGLCME